MTAKRDTLTSVQLCRAAGCTYRQLDYWTRRGLIEPAVQAEGSGTRRGWSVDDIPRVRRLVIAARFASGSILDALDLLDDLDQLAEPRSDDWYATT